MAKLRNVWGVMPRRRGVRLSPFDALALAQGGPGISTPGNRPKTYRALKHSTRSRLFMPGGRQTEHGKNTPLPCNHLSPFQGESFDGTVPQG
jgi:hypothetical protein